MIEMNCVFFCDIKLFRLFSVKCFYSNSILSLISNLLKHGQPIMPIYYKWTVLTLIFLHSFDVDPSLSGHHTQRSSQAAYQSYRDVQPSDTTPSSSIFSFSIYVISLDKVAYMYLIVVFQMSLLFTISLSLRMVLFRFGYFHIYYCWIIIVIVFSFLEFLPDYYSFMPVF